MPPRSQFASARRHILRAFSELPQRVLTRSDIENVLREHRDAWLLPQSVGVNQFLEYLLKRTKLREHHFDLPYRPTVRYSWGDIPTLELVQSLRPEGYFSHFTAMYLHGLTEQSPKTIYLNFEQKLKGGGGELSQASIDRAFRVRCRVSSNTTVFGEQSICVLNGQNTGRLGVIDFDSDAGEGLRVTNIERTLIDIAVRPVYSGGVFQVAQAYRAAQGQVSVNRLVAYLRKLSFTYPYHQVIGFYLELAGNYAKSQLELLRQFPIEFDFYLAHEIRQKDYVPQWRLYVPKGL
jgi:hypothetical protein